MVGRPTHRRRSGREGLSTILIALFDGLGLELQTISGLADAHT
jgi:hypothetical protein